jgi:hypothetical protein
MKAAATAWAVGCSLAIMALLFTSRRIGRPRAASWLVVLGIFMLAVEEPGLTLWLGLADPAIEPDGMAGLVTAMARAHVLDAAVFGVAAAWWLGRIAFTTFRRGHAGAARVLLLALGVVALAELATTVLVFSRGLPMPGPGELAGASGFGWQPVAVGLTAWAAGLALRACSTDRPLAALSAGKGAARP